MKKKKWLTSYKAMIAIGCGVALSLAILTFSNRATTPNWNNPYFSYGTANNRNSIIQVVDNNRVEVPVVFDIGRQATEVHLEFSGEHELMTGLAMTENSVAVIDGKATSSVIIQFNDNPGLKAGTHFLTVLARDTNTGKIIRQGEINFTYNMHEVIGKCSC